MPFEEGSGGIPTRFHVVFGLSAASCRVVWIKSSSIPRLPKQTHTSALIKSIGGGDQEEDAAVFIDCDDCS